MHYKTEQKVWCFNVHARVHNAVMNHKGWFHKCENYLSTLNTGIMDDKQMVIGMLFWLYGV